MRVILLAVTIAGWVVALAMFLVPAHFYIVEADPSCGTPITHVASDWYDHHGYSGRDNYAPMGPSIDDFFSACAQRSRQRVEFGAEIGVVATLFGVGGWIMHRRRSGLTHATIAQRA